MQGPASSTPAQAPPSPPPPPLPTIVPGVGGSPSDITYQVVTPLTREEVQAIRATRSELSNQLVSAQGRRRNLAESLKTAEGADRAGLEQRLILLDGRILQLESDIAETGRQLTAAGVPLSSSSEPATNIGGIDLSSGQITGITIVLIIFVLFPLVSGLTRLLWKRAARPPQVVESPESRQRLDRLEQAVDTIAVEIERVSEGQRYLTRLLTESPVAVPLGAGQRKAEPVSVRKSDPAGSRDDS